MATLGQAKTLGGVGAILVLLAAIPYAGGILAIIGLILVLVAVKYAADVIGDQKIFNNMIIAVVLAIVGIIVAIVVVLGAVFSFIGLGSIGSFTPGTPPANILSLIGVIILGWVIFWIFLLVSSIFIKRSYDAIGTRLNVGMFKTTGLLYLIGAALTIIFVGIFIVFIADILQIVAFFSIPEQMPPGAQPMPGQGMAPPPPPPM